MDKSKSHGPWLMNAAIDQIFDMVLVVRSIM